MIAALPSVAPDFSSFGASSAVAPKMIGVAIKKENRAAASWPRPATSPITIVAPDREMPGMSAKHWAMPMPSGAFPVQLVQLAFRL